MKIIDLLVKIAKGEEVPKKINFCGRNFEYKKDIYDYLCIDENFDKIEDYCLGVSICKWIFPSMLNDEVEILEEEKKIPEKLKWNEKSQHNVVTDNTKKTLEHLLSRSEQLKKSINEIIDYLKSKGE